MAGHRTQIFTLDEIWQHNKALILFIAQKRLWNQIVKQINNSWGGGGAFSLRRATDWSKIWEVRVKKKSV